MASEICIPRLGSVKSDATLIEWAVGEGAKIACGEMVLNIETEKINYEIRAESSGLLHILVTAGATCAVGTVVGLIAASQEELSQLQDKVAAKALTASAPEVTPTERIRISPMARRIAQEHQVDITTITGSGPRGRIVRDDIEKAKRGSLELDDISGGTFTITNLGSAGAGWRFETSIINPPESAILGIGGISDRAVVKDGQIVIRPIMTYSFTYDHRVIDGARAVQFMSRVIELMETPFKAGDDKND